MVKRKFRFGDEWEAGRQARLSKIKPRQVVYAAVDGILCMWFDFEWCQVTMINPNTGDREPVVIPEGFLL